jgi:2-dehydropantoate 2-reductase
MRLLVVGAGATGGYFGGRLAAAGRDITFLVRPRRADRLKAEGLQILSPHGNLTLKPKLAIAGDITEPFDALLLSVKAFALDQAIDDIALGVGPETMIVPVLNGMKHIEVLCARFGDSAVVGCTCRIASAVDEEGRIVQLTGLHDLSYGEMNGVLSARIKRLDDFIQSAGFNATLSQSIECEMWEKWVMLATVGAVNCLMRGTVGEVEAARRCPFCTGSIGGSRCYRDSFGAPSQSGMRGQRARICHRKDFKCDIVDVSRHAAGQPCGS